MTQSPNVIVFVIDSVRYDHTTVGNYTRDTTPNIQRIADQEDGISFDHAIAHAKHTPKSVASILTGKYPAEHRINYESNRLTDEIKTVAEAFKNEGYETTCISNNGWVSRETELARGFDDCTLLPKHPINIIKKFGIKNVLEFLLNIRNHSAGFQRDIHKHSGAFLLSKLISEKINEIENSSSPHFLYIHFNQPHRAYYPPLAWFDTYAEEFNMSTKDAGEFSMEVHHNLNQKVADGCPFTNDQWEAIKVLYDTEIRYTDMIVGDLFEQIQRQLGETISIITSDHGEHFGERGALAHRYVLDDALLRVPLVTKGIEVESTVAPVQHSDIMCTLLELVGADAEFVDGIDLRKETREFAISQDKFSDQSGLLEKNPDFDLEKFFLNADQALPERTALRTETHRYVLGGDGTEVLFKIPHEARGDNIEDEKSKLCEELNKELKIWFSNHQAAKHGQHKESDNRLTNETKQRLKQMGYLEEDFQ
jgi:uncharacterized sulfatase